MFGLDGQMFGLKFFVFSTFQNWFRSHCTVVISSSMTFLVLYTSLVSSHFGL